MKNNKESALKIKQIITIVLILITLGSTIQLLNLSNGNEEKIAKVKVEEQEVIKIENKVELAQVSNFERTFNGTTRSLEERKLKEKEEKEPEKQYIKIEDIKISRNMDLTQVTGISKEDFKKLLSDLRPDTTGFFEENSDTIYDLCQKYEINEIFFCGLIAAESGWKISSYHRNSNNYVSMMSKGKLIKYNSPEEGLEAAAKLLHDRYLTEGGSYYNGKTLSAVQIRYCPNSSTWVGLVYGCMNVIV